MKKILNFIMSISACVLLSFSNISAYAGTINDQKVKRFNGENSIETSTLISQQGWTSSKTVILVNANSYVNAVSSVTLAYQKNAPILLTDNERLSPKTLEEIKRLKPSDIYVIGDDKVISSTIEYTLKDSGYHVTRIGGTDSINTSINVAEEFIKKQSIDTVFISSVYDFQDELSASTFSAKYGLPIIYTDKKELSEETKKALKKWNIKNVYLLGKVSNDSPNREFGLNIEKSLQELGITVNKFNGENKYEMAMNIIKQFDKGNYNGLTITTGLQTAINPEMLLIHPDVLSASVLAAKENSPMMIYNSQNVNEEISKFISSKISSHVYVVGSEVAVPQSDIDQMQEPIDKASINVPHYSVPTEKMPLASISEDWRKFYFSLDRNYYTGIYESYFDEILKAVAAGNLSKEEAENKLKFLGTWQEPNTNIYHTIFRVDIQTYMTPTSNIIDIGKEINEKRLYRGGTYSNSYVGFDEGTRQNRVVMMAIDMTTRETSSQTFSNK